MKIGNTTLIPQNVAPKNVKKVIIFDSNGNRVCECDLGHLTMPQLGTKKYSAGLLSDTHMTTAAGSDEEVDLARAINYFKSVADMTCICGDLCNVNETGQLEKHKAVVDANKGDMPVYAIPGNHGHISNTALNPLNDEQIKAITGYPLYYTVSNQPADEASRNYYSAVVGDDVYIMCGAVRWGDGNSMFDATSFQWLQETLDENRNKRCFLFFHAPIDDAQHCGDALNVITWDGLGTYRTRFIKLLQHYNNVIYFHGHTHAMLEMQDYLQGLNPPLPANYDFTDGIHSVHIPSCAISRDISSGDRVDVTATSQGYLMDVYENHIVLRGRDFVKGEFIPIAQYCLDTTIQTVESKPYSYFS